MARNVGITNTDDTRSIPADCPCPIMVNGLQKSGPQFEVAAQFLTDLASEMDAKEADFLGGIEYTSAQKVRYDCTNV